MNPLFGMVLVLATLGIGFVVLRQIEKHLSPHPEILRKLMHMWMGLVTLAFPWLFHDAWPVVSLAVVSFFVLMLVRRGIPGTRRLQGVLHGVERASWGELLFPPAIAVVFVLAEGDALLYTVPVLILALSDAVAALIGVHYGQIRFSTLEGYKSIEGSLAFFIVTFLCVQTALLLFTEVGRAETLLISALMGVVVMMVEAMAWRGLDNLFIPIASFSLLQVYLELETAALLLRLVVILLLGVFLLFLRRLSTLDDSALIGAVLVGYGAWALGGVPWLLVPLTAFIIATVTTQWGREDLKPFHTVHALLSIAGPGLVWLFLSGHGGEADLFFAYSVAFAAHLTMLGISRHGLGREHLRAAHFMSPVAQGLLIVMLAFLLTGGSEWRLLLIMGIGSLAMIAAAMGFVRLQPALHDCPGSVERWTRQALIAGGVSALAWLALLVMEGRPLV